MGCESIFKSLMARIETAVKDKWPHTLDTPGFIEFAEKHHPEMKKKHDALYAEANQLWLNCQDHEFKKVSTEWGKIVLKMYQLFDGYLRVEREVA
jgi:hypothetical protein